MTPLSLVLHWEGVGDIVVCATILHGLAADHPGREVRFYVTGRTPAAAQRWLEWAKFFWPASYDATVDPVIGERRDLGPPGQPEPELDPSNRELRHVLWAAICGTRPKPVTPMIPNAAHNEAQFLLQRIGVDLSRPFVYFAPVAKEPERNWPLRSWHRLEELLDDVQVIVGAAEPMPWASASDLARFRTRFRIGVEPPAVMAAILRRSLSVVSNDSGFAHLGGILRVPTIAVTGGTYDGPVVFGWYDSVKVVQAASRRVEDVPAEEVLRALVARSGSSMLAGARNAPGSAR